MMPPTSIDGTDITGATIDGTDVQEITVDGQTVFTAKKIIDNFEESLYEDKNNSLSDYYGGDLAAYSRQQTTVFEGAYTLQASVGAGERAVIASGTVAPDTTPQQGDTFRCNVQISNASDQLGVMFGTQEADSTPGGYVAAIEGNTNSLSIFRYTTSGFDTVLNRSSFTFSDNEEYIFEVDWGTDDSITIRALDTNENELVTVSDTDSDYTSGGVGFYISESGGNSSSLSAFFDDYRIV